MESKCSTSVALTQLLCRAVDELPFKQVGREGVLERLRESIKGADSPMPPPVRGFRPLIDVGDMITKDDD
jgi:hypothetical protein